VAGRQPWSACERQSHNWKVHTPRTPISSAEGFVDVPGSFPSWMTRGKNQILNSRNRFEFSRHLPSSAAHMGRGKRQTSAHCRLRSL
jgi:hypothetical protein